MQNNVVGHLFVKDMSSRFTQRELSPELLAGLIVYRYSMSWPDILYVAEAIRSNHQTGGAQVEKETYYKNILVVV